MTDDAARALIADLPGVDGLVGVPRDYVVKGRPSSEAAEAAGTDLDALDAWVAAQGGQVRSGRGGATGGVRPGRRSAPPPAPPQRVYVLPASALAS